MVTTAWVYCGGVALLALERLGELLLSRRNARRALSQGAIEVGQSHFRIMSLLHAAFLAACVLEVVLFHRAFPLPWGWMFVGGSVLAQALRYWAIFTLGDRWNVRIIVRPATEPVVAGPYRWVRHPNYVAVMMEMVCVPLIHGAWVTALLFSAANAVLLRVRIRAEETALGKRYAELFADRARFIPKLRGS